MSDPSPASAAAMKPESRWGAALAIAIAIPLQISLPDEVAPPLAWGFLGLCVVLLLALLIANPRRLGPEERRLRKLSIVVIICLALSNLVSLIALLTELLSTTPSPVSGRSLIIAAAAIWATGVIVYGLLYWELDGGGPQERAAGKIESRDFLFPQDQPDLEATIWAPRLVDYVYVALTNAMAFSPADTMPLSRKAKALMGTQSVMSLTTIAVVGAYAVGVLRS